MSKLTTPPQGVPVILNRDARPHLRRPPDSVWSTPGGNDHAFWRDLSPFRDTCPFFKEFHPRSEAHDGFELAEGDLHFYVAPGQGVSTRTRKVFHSYRARLRNVADFPRRIEIEFARARPYGADSKPERFRGSAVAWALEVCDTVLLCLDHAPGEAAGEAHRVVAPLQVVFRCAESDAVTWQAYFSARLKTRHTLTVVHTAAGRA